MNPRQRRETSQPCQSLCADHCWCKEMGHMHGCGWQGGCSTSCTSHRVRGDTECGVTPARARPALPAHHRRTRLPIYSCAGLGSGNLQPATNPRRAACELGRATDCAGASAARPATNLGLVVLGHEFKIDIMGAPQPQHSLGRQGSQRWSAVLWDTLPSHLHVSIPIILQFILQHDN